MTKECMFEVLRFLSICIGRGLAVVLGGITLYATLYVLVVYAPVIGMILLGLAICAVIGAATMDWHPYD